MDYSTLVPGDIIPQEQCEVIFGFTMKSDLAKYSLCLLNLKGQVEKELRKVGRIYTVTTQKGRINVLTHQQASQYNRRMFVAKKKSMRKANHRLAFVDISVLSHEERKEHEKQLIRQGREIMALNQVREDFRVSSHRSDLPKFIG